MFRRRRFYAIRNVSTTRVLLVSLVVTHSPLLLDFWLSSSVSSEFAVKFGIFTYLSFGETK